MRLKSSDFVPFIASTFSLAIGVFFCFSSGSASAQATKSPRPEPRLPGAIEKAPDWLKDAPFDMAKFFEMPPAAQNAAPLYLEAFFEFGTELELIYPPEIRQRSAAIAERARQAATVWQAWDKDPEKADRKAIDRLLAEYKEGFRKLDLAQKRPKCVFATGFAYDSLLPHAQVSRNVAKVLLLRANRALDRDDFEAAIGDFQRIFRLSRDLRPRGAAISQIVGISFDYQVCKVGIDAILAHRNLKVEHCDRLLKLLADHEAQAIDPFSEGMKAEHFMYRFLLREFTEGIKPSVDPNGKATETRFDRAGLVQELGVLFQQVSPQANEIPEPKRGELLDQFRREAAKDRAAAIDWTRSLLAAKPDYPDRTRVLAALDAKYLKPPALTLFKLILPDNRLFLLSCGRAQAYLGSAKCLVALRRWQLTHATTSTDLAEVCRASKLPGVPIDPFSGSPLKLAMIEGEPVIYSVGPDGVDDKAVKDSKMGRNPEGDLLFPLPKRK